ncbi:MAG: radical SAM protein [Promethearchaeota archaeon]
MTTLPDKLLNDLLAVQSRKNFKNFKIAKTLKLNAPKPLEELTINDCWKLHDVCHLEFLGIKEKIKNGQDPSDFDQDRNDKKNTKATYLDLKIALALKLITNCGFCESNCGANRIDGEKGRCLVSNTSHVSSAFLHFGEEPPLIPSGTIFFSGCNFKCVFCQNDDISTRPDNGVAVDAKSLAKIASSLARDGAKNINYVGGDPIPNLHNIVTSLKYQYHDTAQLWNSKFFNTMESLKLILDVMDIWLPDFKYGNDDCARRLSGINNYWSTLTRNLKYVHDEMVKRGMASLIIRHLVLPNHVDCCTIPILKWISKNLPLAMVNIMGQYRPQHLVLKRINKYQDIERRPSIEEMRRARGLADELGIVWQPVS